MDAPKLIDYLSLRLRWQESQGVSRGHAWVPQALAVTAPPPRVLAIFFLPREQADGLCRDVQTWGAKHPRARPKSSATVPVTAQGPGPPSPSEADPGEGSAVRGVGGRGRGCPQARTCQSRGRKGVAVKAGLQGELREGAEPKQRVPPGYWAAPTPVIVQNGQDGQPTASALPGHAQRRTSKCFRRAPRPACLDCSFPRTPQPAWPTEESAPNVSRSTLIFHAGVKYAGASIQHLLPFGLPSPTVALSVGNGVLR